MKKILSVFACLVLMLSMLSMAAFSTSAAGFSISVSPAANTVADGAIFDLTVSISGASAASSGSIAVEADPGITVQSGRFLAKTNVGPLVGFFINTNKGAITYDPPVSPNGEYFELTVKVSSAANVAKKIKFTVDLKNGTASLGSASTTATVTVACTDHFYGGWTDSKDGKNHQKVCSVCSNTVKEAHKWSSRVTKEATFTETGTRTYTCDVCRATKTETIPKLSSCSHPSSKQKTETVKEATCTADGTQKIVCKECGETVKTVTVKAKGHSYGSWKTTKAATCTASGTESRTCSACNKVETRTIAAKGHSFGSWNTTKAPTCTEEGEATRKCKNCSETEKKAVAMTGHDFEEPVVVREASIAHTGLVEGKCKNCGEATSQELPCSVTDAATGVVFETDEGVFAEGTEMNIAQVDAGSDRYNEIKKALPKTAGEYVAYDIGANNAGQAVQPNGKLKVTLKAPADYGEDMEMYCVDNAGNAEKIVYLTNDDGTLSAYLSKLGKLAICQTKGSDAGTTKKTTAQPGNDGEKEATIPLWLFIVVIGVLLVIGVVAVCVVVNKRRTFEDDE